MLHGLYGFCWLAVCCENWVGFCVRNSVSHIYGSFYFSVSGFCMFLCFFIYTRFCEALAGLNGAPLIIYILFIKAYYDFMLFSYAQF